MILCDIGNSFVKFYDNKQIKSMSIDEFIKFKPTNKIYYISVNDNINDKLNDANFIDISPMVHFQTNYVGLGIDRACACYSISNGLVVDAGSAITIDLVTNNKHEGGLIMPGFNAILNMLKSISARLQKPFNSQLDIDKLPLMTKDAISYGIIKPLILTIKDIAKDYPIYITGGDGMFLTKFFKNAVYDEALVFRGMLKAIHESAMKGV